MRPRLSTWLGTSALFTGLGWAGAALAQPAATPGFPEPIVHWKVQSAETCDDVAKAMYGSAKHVNLLYRYNSVKCDGPLEQGKTLVLPAAVSTVQSATLRSVHPQVQARAPGGGWSQAGAGMPLYVNANVNSLDEGRAGIEFVDRTRVYLAENTLVIIYTTAAQTRVSKTPPVMQLERGEIKAGLSALRGEPVGVDMNGGRVTVQSGEAVMRQKGDTATVTALKGRTTVASGGKTVEVAENHGTQFVRAQAPEPPRPLPPAPAWAASVSPEAILLAPNGKRSFEASWSAAAGAARYRLEIARDESFHDLPVRTEVPADVTRFRVESLPRGTYAMSVYTIDAQDYLGAPSSKRVVHLVNARVDGEASGIKDEKITANPYGTLALSVPPAIEVVIDDRPVVGTELEIDFTKRRPERLELRARGSGVKTAIPIEYPKITSTLSSKVTADGEALEVSATFSGLGGIDVPGRVAPSVRVHLPGGVRGAPLEARGGGLFAATIPLESAPERMTIDLVDGRGEHLGSTEALGPRRRPSVAPPPAEAPPISAPRIGVTLPPSHNSSVTGVTWWSPTTPDAAGIGATTGSADEDGSWSFEAQTWASGGIGPFGVDARIHSNVIEGPEQTKSTAWLGARWRAYRSRGADVELGPAVRVGIPLTEMSPPLRIEPALALGGSLGRWTWLINAGIRVRLIKDSDQPDFPGENGFLLLGGTVDLAPWLRAQALLDAHLLPDPRVRGGLGLGLEAGENIFGSLSARASPWSDDGGVFAAQLALGLRGWEPSEKPAPARR